MCMYLLPSDTPCNSPKRFMFSIPKRKYCILVPYNDCNRLQQARSSAANYQFHLQYSLLAQNSDARNGRWARQNPSKYRWVQSKCRGLFSSKTSSFLTFSLWLGAPTVHVAFGCITSTKHRCVFSLELNTRFHYNHLVTLAGYLLTRDCISFLYPWVPLKLTWHLTYSFPWPFL